METSMIIRSVNFIILLGVYISIIISAFISLRKRRLFNRHKTFWVFAILVFPFLGAIALWIVNPQNEVNCHGSTGE